MSKETDELRDEMKKQTAEMEKMNLAVAGFGGFFVGTWIGEKIFGGEYGSVIAILFMFAIVAAFLMLLVFATIIALIVIPIFAAYEIYKHRQFFKRHFVTELLITLWFADTLLEGTYSFALNSVYYWIVWFGFWILDGLLVWRLLRFVSLSLKKRREAVPPSENAL